MPFEPLPPGERTASCKHPEHAPPMYLYVPDGVRFRHECPACGDVTYIYPAARNLQDAAIDAEIPSRGPAKEVS